MPDSAVQIRDYRNADVDAWRRYVLAHGQGTVFHRLAWSRAVEEAYGHRPAHLTAWAGSRLVGVLPMFLIRSLLVGKVMVSVPYATYGGILADDPRAMAALLEAAKDRCRQHGARYLELRHREANELGLPEIDRYDTFRKELPPTPEDVLRSLPRKTRAAAKKGVKSLTASFGADLLDTVYDLYAVTLRRLGSPNYRRRLFRALAANYGEDCVCLVVRSAGRPVAGVISYVFRDEIVPYFSGSLPEGMRANANNVLYVRLMEHAVERGLRWFDFNRTRRDNRGPHAFKRYHGFEPAPLHYQVYLNGGGELPNLSPSNRKYALAGRVWRNLPLCLTQSVGSAVTKWIP